MIIPNLNFGGAQTSYIKLSNELSREFDVINVAFNQEKVFNHGLNNILYLDIPASDNPVYKIYYFIKRIRKLKAIKNKYKFDVSISFLEGADYVNVLSKCEEKIILSIRGSKIYDQNISGILGVVRKKFLIPFLYNKSDYIVSLNEGIKFELINRFNIKKPIEVIYNWFDLEVIGDKKNQKIDSRFEKIFNNKVIISHGRLAYEKGFIDLIKVFHKIRSISKIKCKLVIIGNGAERVNLIRACNRFNLRTWDFYSSTIFNLDADVFFLGYQENPYPFLTKSSVFTLTSHHEGFGNSLVEAMACGVPVIATDCPYGPSEILQDLKVGIAYRQKEHVLNARYGILAPPFNETNSHKLWADMIIKFLESENYRVKYASNSLEGALQFSSNNNYFKWRNLINRIT